MTRPRPLIPAFGKVFKNGIARQERAEQRKLGQKAIARYLGTHEREVRRMISGLVPSEVMLERLCEVLPISTEELQRALEGEEKRGIRPAGVSFIRGDLKKGSIALAKRMKKFDFSIIPDLTDENEVASEELGPILLSNPHTWCIILNERNKMIGYWRFVPLRGEIYERARNGDLLDEELTEDVMEDFQFSDIYNIYVAFMGILPKYIRHQHGLLFSSFFDAISELSEVGTDIYIASVCVNALTATARKLCRGLNMRPLCKHKHVGDVFETHMVAILNRMQEKDPTFFRKYGGLVERYQARFGSNHKSGRGG